MDADLCDRALVRRTERVLKRSLFGDGLCSSSPRVLSLSRRFCLLFDGTIAPGLFCGADGQATF